jgi:hypothetical protein
VKQTEDFKKFDSNFQEDYNQIMDDPSVPKADEESTSNVFDNTCSRI